MLIINRIATKIILKYRIQNKYKILLREKFKNNIMTAKFYQKNLRCNSTLFKMMLTKYSDKLEIKTINLMVR
jgi:hypothetical protein